MPRPCQVCLLFCVSHMRQYAGGLCGKAAFSVGDTTERLRITVTGVVQGVGFRFTAQRLAEGLDIKGWVKNLPNGAVQLVAEGSEENLNKLLGQLKTHFKDDIEDTQISWEEPIGKFSEFRVAF